MACVCGAESYICAVFLEPLRSLVCFLHWYYFIFGTMRNEKTLVLERLLIQVGYPGLGEKTRDGRNPTDSIGMKDAQGVSHYTTLAEPQDIVSGYVWGMAFNPGIDPG